MIDWEEKVRSHEEMLEGMSKQVKLLTEMNEKNSTSQLLILERLDALNRNEVSPSAVVKNDQKETKNQVPVKENKQDKQVNDCNQYFKII
jgi:hypothetical protein